jgi:hypothetical protein
MTTSNTWTDGTEAKVCGSVAMVERKKGNGKEGSKEGRKAQTFGILIERDGVDDHFDSIFEASSVAHDDVGVEDVYQGHRIVSRDVADLEVRAGVSVSSARQRFEL